MNKFWIDNVGIPHIINCPSCNGFGFYGEHGNLVTLQNALEHKHGLITMESGHEALTPCDVCGSTIDGVIEELIDE